MAYQAMMNVVQPSIRPSPDYLYGQVMVHEMAAWYGQARCRSGCCMYQPYLPALNYRNYQTPTILEDPVLWSTMAPLPLQPLNPQVRHVDEVPLDVAALRPHPSLSVRTLSPRPLDIDLMADVVALRAYYDGMTRSPITIVISDDEEADVVTPPEGEFRRGRSTRCHRA